MNRLTVVAVAAIVALASGVALVRYVAGAEDRATATAELVPILVATADVADGTPFSEAWESGDIERSEILQGMRPATAIVDPSELAGAVVDGVLFKGQLVVQGVFMAPGDADAALPRTFADSLPDGTVAVSFEAAGAQAVSDLVSPGDRVDLLVQVPNAAELGLPDSGGPAVVRAFHNLQVIAIGAAVAPTAGSETAVDNPGGGSYSVAVSPRDAARLLFLTRQYEVFLTLIGPGATSTAQDPVTRADALPDGVTADDAVPAGEDTGP